MSTYSAEQIIGKNLIANKKVNLYRLPDDNAKPVFAVNAGDTVGVVFSYIAPSLEKKRKFLYWQFKDQNGKFYYVRHAENTFNIKALKDQGTKTVEETTNDAETNKVDKIFKEYVVPVLLGAGAIYILTKLGTAYITRPAY